MSSQNNIANLNLHITSMHPMKSLFNTKYCMDGGDIKILEKTELLIAVLDIITILAFLAILYLHDDLIPIATFHVNYTYCLGEHVV